MCVCDVRISGKYFRTWAIFSYRRHTVTHRKQQHISHLFRGVFTLALLLLIRCEDVAFTQTEVNRCVCARRFVCVLRDEYIARATENRVISINNIFEVATVDLNSRHGTHHHQVASCLVLFFHKELFNIFLGTFATNTYILQFASFAEFSQAV